MKIIKVTSSIIKQCREYRSSDIIDSHHIERISKSNFVEYFYVYVTDKKLIQIPNSNFLQLIEVYCILIN